MTNRTRAPLDLVNDALYWFWHHPETKRIIHVDGTHTDVSAEGMGYAKKLGIRPNPRTGWKLEDERLIGAAIADGWVRGRFGRRAPAADGAALSWHEIEEWGERPDLKTGWGVQLGPDYGGAELSLQGSQRNVWLTANAVLKAGKLFETLLVDFTTKREMESLPLTGRALRVFLRTGKLLPELAAVAAAPQTP